MTSARPGWRPSVAVLLAYALAGHLAVQYWVLGHVVARSRVARQEYTAIADRLHLLGVRPPCVVTGFDAVPIGYYAGCASRQIGGHDGSITTDGLRAAARHTPVAVIVAPGHKPPAYARAWRPETVPPLRGARTSPSTWRPPNDESPRCRLSGMRPPPISSVAHIGLRPVHEIR